MAFGMAEDFYANDGYNDLENFARVQTNQSRADGYEAANMADPYGTEKRKQAGDAYDKLLSNPGGIETSPFYKYLLSTQMEAVKASNAARGLNNSGRGMLELQKAARGAATGAFFPLAELYGKTSGALNPLSPVAAGMALRGNERGQDYASIAAAARASGSQPQQNRPSALPFGGATSTPYSGSQSPGWSSALPSGTGYYTKEQLAGAGYPTGPSPSSMTNEQLNAAAGNDMLPSTGFGYDGLPLNNNYGATDTAAMAEQNYYGYDNA